MDAIVELHAEPPPGIEIPGYLRSPLPGASKEVPDGTAAGSPGFQSRAAEAADAPGKDDARLSTLDRNYGDVFCREVARVAFPSAAFQAASGLLLRLYLLRLYPRAMPWAKGERPLRASSQLALETGCQGWSDPLGGPRMLSGPKAWAPLAQPNGLGCDRSPRPPPSPTGAR